MFAVGHTLEVHLKVEVEKLGGGQVRLQVEISAEEVNAELERNYKALRTQVAVPGFRRGRVPKSIIKARFAEHIKTEAIQNLVPPAYEDALISKQLTPLSSPEISPSFDQIELAENQPLVFEATVDIKPDFVLPDYKDLVIDKTAADVPREDVQAYIYRLQEQHATFDPLEEERPVQEGDSVRIDCEYLVDGQPIEHLTQEDVDIELGRGMLPPEAESGIIGMEAGSSKQIDVTIDEANPNPALAGKSVVLNLALNAITEKRLPHLDDEFAKDIGYENYEQLHGAVWNNLVEEEKSRIRERQQAEVLQELIDKTDIEIPNALVEQSVQQTLENIQRQLQTEGRTPEEAGIDMETLPEELREDITKQTKQSWLFDAIAEQESIRMADDELDIEIRHAAEQQNRDAQKYASLLKASDRLEDFREQLRNEKIYRFLIERASAKRSLILR